VAENVIVTVLGRKGMGKTTLVKELIREYPRVVVLDTNGEYGDAVAEQYGELGEAVHRLAEVAPVESHSSFSIAYVPDQIPEDGLAFLSVAWEVTDCLVVVDEAAMYCASFVLPDEISKLVRLGRHRAISQVYVAQRAASLPRDITAQSDCVVSFQQHEGRDLEYMRQLFGERAEALRTIPKYKLMLFGDAEKAPLAALARGPVEPPQNRVDTQGKLF